METLKNAVFKIIGEKNTQNLKYVYRIRKYGQFKKYKNIKKILFLSSPAHGNLGDQAIAKATIKFCNDYFPDYTVLEFYKDEIYDYGITLNKILNPDDMVLIHGGGNMGNLYVPEEESRRLVIKKFKKNKIISMPQTIDFSDDEEGNAEKKISQKIYAENKNLILIAREDKSYEDMKKTFPENKVMEFPDIVFYLENIFPVKNKERKGILTCLRSDKESYYGQKKEKFLEDLKQYGKEISVGDTVVDRRVYRETRETELQELWNKFRHSELVITDRLHGMIFSFITKTPCIVLRSLDHKVIETYKWLKDLNHIKFAEDLEYEKIKPLIDELIEIGKKGELQTTDFKGEYFDKLAEVFKQKK